MYIVMHVGTQLEKSLIQPATVTTGELAVNSPMALGVLVHGLGAGHTKQADPAPTQVTTGMGHARMPF